MDRAKRPNDGRHVIRLCDWAGKPDDPSITGTTLNHVLLHHGTPAHLTAFEADLQYGYASTRCNWVQHFSATPIPHFWQSCDTDWKGRAESFGWGTHYIEDSGQPYHTNLVQSLGFPAIDWLNIHTAVESYMENQYPDTAQTSESFDYRRTVYNAKRRTVSSASNAAVTLGDLSGSLLGNMVGIVDLVYNKNLGNDASALEWSRSLHSEAAFNTVVRATLDYTASCVKGAFVSCTNTLIAPESVPLLTSALSQTSATLAPGGEARMDSAGAVAPFARTVQDSAQVADFVEEWSQTPESLRVVLRNPGQPVTLINTYTSGGIEVEHPDLAVVATALEQPTLYAGETVAIQSVLFNAGRPPVSNVPVELRADGATVDVQPVSFAGLMPEVVTFHWTPAADGPHELSVVIDPFGQVDEASSAQDSAGGPVTILSNTENNIQIDSLWVGFETGPPPVAVRRVPGAAGGSVRSPSAQLDLPAGFSYRTVTFGLGEIVPESTGIAPASGDSYTGPIVNLTPHVLEMLRPATLTVRVNWPGDPGLLQPFRFEDSTATWVPVMLGGGPVAGGWAFVIDRTGMYSVQGGGGVTETEQVEVVSADADSRQARVTWFVPATLRGEEAVVCRHAPGGAWIALASVVPDGTGRVVYVDTDVRPGQRITYGLRLPSGDPARIVGEVTLEIPQADAFKLDGPRSNPSVGPLIVSFSLPSEAAATLELLDPAGRRVRALALTALGPGNHWLNLSEGGRLASGFYLLRLKQGDRSLTRRVAVLQ